MVDVSQCGWQLVFKSSVRLHVSQKGTDMVGVGLVSLVGATLAEARAGPGAS